MPYLINDAYLTTYTSVEIQNNAKNIKAALQAVTVINVKPLLGVRLYELYEQHVQDGTELTPKQAELLEIIRYWMALRVEREMLYNVLKISNKGATEESNAANMEVVKMKRQDVESKAETMRKSILEYLETNKADFPEFYPETPQITTTQTSNYSFGIAFDFGPKRWIQ